LDYRRIELHDAIGGNRKKAGVVQGVQVLPQEVSIVGGILAQAPISPGAMRSI